jgi:hypothetical protein
MTAPDLVVIGLRAVSFVAVMQAAGVPLSVWNGRPAPFAGWPG